MKQFGTIPVDEMGEICTSSIKHLFLLDMAMAVDAMRAWMQYNNFAIDFKNIIRT